MFENINKLKKVFSSFSDETRLKIMISLMDSPKTVNEIFDAIKCNITLSAVSHQLRHLTDVNLVVYEKNGREKTYSLTKDFCWCILREGIKHVTPDSQCGCRKLKDGKN